MYNETLQDIFDEFYARETKREKNQEIQDLTRENKRLYADLEDKENDIYDRNDTIETMNYEISRAQKAFEDCVKDITELKDKIKKLEEGPLKEARWHLEQAKID